MKFGIAQQLFLGLLAEWRSACSMYNSLPTRSFSCITKCLPDPEQERGEDGGQSEQQEQYAARKVGNSRPRGCGLGLISCSEQILYKPKHCQDVESGL